jgi:hypothetical protein
MHHLLQLSTSTPPACLLPVLQVEGLGIPSVAQLFLDFGYSQRDMLTFPAKKLRVRQRCGGSWLVMKTAPVGGKLHTRHLE